MKELLLLRHAKSSWKQPDLEDFYRPLKQKGINDASIIGEYIKQIDLIPQYIVCSDSVRTKDTLDIILKKINFKNNIKFSYNHSLYEASVDDILKVISQIDNEFNRVMIVGHNPGMEDTVLKLTQKPFPFPKFSTCGLALLELNIDNWKDIKNSKAILKLFKSPKMFN